MVDRIMLLDTGVTPFRHQRGRTVQCWIWFVTFVATQITKLNLHQNRAVDFQSLQEAGVELVDHEAITLARAFGRYQGPPARKADIDVSKLLLAMDFDMTQRVEQKP